MTILKDNMNTLGLRALQTLTTTGTNAVFMATQTPDGSDNSGNENGNLFGGSNSTPLVPAFVLTGFLLAAILLMTWWRRVANPRGMRMPFTRVGGGLFYFPGTFEGPGTGAERKEKQLGPRPEMFDVLMGMAEKKGLEEKEILWEDVQPLSARYERPATRQVPKNKNKKTVSNANERTSSSPNATPFQRWFSSRREPTPITEKAIHLTTPPPGQMHISVLIAMPSPSRPHPNDRRSSETVETVDSIAKAKGKGRSLSEEPHTHNGDESHLDDLDLVLGFTSVPFAARSGGSTGA